MPGMGETGSPQGRQMTSREELWGWLGDGRWQKRCHGIISNLASSQW